MLRDRNKETSVLVAEDDREQLAAIEKMLQLLGVGSVKGVGTGEEAVQWLKDRHPDLLILDLNMPDMDGIQLLSRLQSDKDKPAIILMSGDVRVLASAKKLADAYGAGPIGCLEKPFHLADLSDLILHG